MEKPIDIFRKFRRRPERDARLNVAINSDMVAAIRNVVDSQEVSVTEAVRQIVTYGDLVIRTAQEGHEIIIHDPKEDTYQQLHVIGYHDPEKYQ